MSLRLLEASTWALVGLQAFMMFIDEFVCHRARGLGNWERWGHPLDSVFIFLALLVPAAVPFSREALLLYVAMAVLSALVVTKDEWIHTESCGALEHWVHAMMFLMHPTLFFCVGFLWAGDHAIVLRSLLPVLAISLGIFQAVFWGVFGDSIKKAEHARD